MTSSALALLVVLTAAGQVRMSGAIRPDELEYQQEAFRTWWGQELAVKLDDLPSEGKVPDFRIPYAGHDYPDRGGGTIAALAKYDRAFFGGRMVAGAFEREDVSAHRNGHRDEVEFRRGLFGRIRAVRSGRGVPTWYGHCNGWTAAAIRHAEPQRSVVRNGVVFTPADIKGLLADLYMYSPTEFLGGMDDAINPGMMHVTLGNWLGLGSHPVGVEAALGEVVINYPIYSYKATVNRFSARQAEVRNIITYRLNTPREYDKGPANFSRTMYFHYVLDLNANGEITGGRYYGDSARVDMLWTPLKPVQGGEKGNERGNPHLSAKEVLAIWRESVPEPLRKQWLNVDPTVEDRVLPPEPAPAPATAEAPVPEPAPAAEAPVAAAAAPADSNPVAAPATEAESREPTTAAPAPAAGEAAPPAPSDAPAPAAEPAGDRAVPPPPPAAEAPRAEDPAVPPAPPAGEVPA